MWPSITDLEVRLLLAGHETTVLTYSAFGFAYSQTLRNEGSTNAGLRDQRLGIEWVRDNIREFGGDPEKITIHGQSSGGRSLRIIQISTNSVQDSPWVCKRSLSAVPSLYRSNR